MAIDPSVFLSLTLPAGAALALLGLYLLRSAGVRRTSAFFAAAATYAVVRALAVRWVTEGRLGGRVPYVLRQPLASLYGVSLQEIAGWLLALALAWTLGERLSRRSGSGAHGAALAGALVLAALCMAVESAAIVAGWWSWSLDLPADGWRRFPWVAVLDWSFVAFDFLLPFLLFSRPAAWRDRLVAATLFPLHLAAHLSVAGPERFSLPVYDLLHAAIVAWVFARAALETAGKSFEEPGRSILRFAPQGAAAIVLAATAITLARSGADRSLLALLPLLGITALASRSAGAAGSATSPLSPRRPARVALVLLVLFALFLAWRLPAAARERRFRGELERGLASWSAGDTATAEEALGRAAAMRPEHTGARLALVKARISRGRIAEARQELERLVASRTEANEALALLVALELRAGEIDSARRRLKEEATRRPLSPELSYLDTTARQPPAPAAVAAAFLAAQRSGREAVVRLREVALARLDAETIERCEAWLALPAPGAPQ